jgi:hypothetical protein
MNMEDCFVLSRIQEYHLFPDGRQRDHYQDGDINLTLSPLMSYIYMELLLKPEI